jgi:hypothetical protein
MLAGTLLPSCSGTGQDSDTLAGVPWSIPRFVDKCDQTMSDTLTGLIWSKEANPTATTKTWQGELDYIKSISSSNYLGYNDWRLPNIIELESLINKQLSSPFAWLNVYGTDGPPSATTAAPSPATPSLQAPAASTAMAFLTSPMCCSVYGVRLGW